MPKYAPNKMSTSVKKRYFELLREGYKGAAAALVVGVSTGCGSLWFIDAGSMIVPDPGPISPRFLTQDDRIAIADGLKGLPDAVETLWPRTSVHACIVHLLRNSFRYASRADCDKIAKALKPVCTAPSEGAATPWFPEFAETWGKRYPAIVRLRESAWVEFVPLLSFDVEIRTVTCSTNAIESVNARIHKAVRACGHFPTEAAALRCIHPRH